MRVKNRTTEWLAHVETAHREGKTVAGYAREHGLPRHGMYKAVQRRGQVVQAAARQGGSTQANGQAEPGSAFVEVKVASTPACPRTGQPRLLARLPNGVEVELVCDGADADLLAVMMESLWRTPCSASTSI